MCYLQLRKICELIALACLVAHGDISQVRARKYHKQYHATVIMRELTALHTSFYPVPSRQILDPATGTVDHLELVTDPFLTKNELMNLYSACGEVLHRGSLEKLLSDKGPPLDFVKIRMWNDKITSLLNHHHIQLIDKNLQIWVVMQGKEDGMVHTSVMAVVGSQHDSIQSMPPQNSPSLDRRSRAARRKSSGG